jgi:hypothetical protein
MDQHRSSDTLSPPSLPFGHDSIDLLDPKSKMTAPVLSIDTQHEDMIVRHIALSPSLYIVVVY